MQDTKYVGKEKPAKALSQIRRDMAYFHRDHAYAAGDRTRWIFLILWLLVALTMHGLFYTGGADSLAFGGIIVGVYAVLDGLYIHRRARKVAEQPLEPTFDTHVDLS